MRKHFPAPLQPWATLALWEVQVCGGEAHSPRQGKNGLHRKTSGRLCAFRTKWWGAAPGVGTAIYQKGTRFNAKQKGYLDEKFKIGEQSGHKADPAQVAKDMRHARQEDGNRRFTVDEFLTPQQIKSYFSRAAAKLQQGDREDECDFQAIEEQEAYSSTCVHVIDECQLIHPITYDTFNLCDMYATRKLTRLSISMLPLICSHWHGHWQSFTIGQSTIYWVNW